MNELLTRKVFRARVLARDGNKCVHCGVSDKSLVAHHIIERRLFDNGGYYIDNGASLCSECHILAESTLLSAQALRDAIGISEVILPSHLYRDYHYDKWGNIIQEDGTRLRGELFYDRSVQKIMKPVLNLFVIYMKYPRTYHLPWTASMTSDDRMLDSVEQFEDRRVVVTEKMDGENSTIYSDGYFHARSINGHNHPSQSWLKNYMQKWCYDLPTGWRVCGENLYATHSLKYRTLPSYFLVFSIWDENNICLSWEDTKVWCGMLELETVPVLYEGMFFEEDIKTFSVDKKVSEGYVVRLEKSFSYQDFRKSTGKYVRKDHVETTAHNWRMRWDSRKVNEMKKR